MRSDTSIKTPQLKSDGSVRQVWRLKINLLPREVRDMSLPDSKSVVPFKTKLDHFLASIPDQPTVQNRRRPASSNSLLDQIPMTVRSL